MKLSLKIIIVLILSVGLTAVNVIVIKTTSNYEPKMKVVYANTNITEKMIITDDMLVEKEISLSLVLKNSVNTMKRVVGKKAKYPIFKGEMVLTDKIGDPNEIKEIELSDKNNHLITVEFKPDQANGWWVLVGQYVDIIYIPNQNITADMPTIGLSSDPSAVLSTQKAQRIENIRIAAIFDEQMQQMSNEKRDSIPKMICFEVPKGIDEQLIEAKNSGRLELSVKASE